MNFARWFKQVDLKLKARGGDEEAIYELAQLYLEEGTTEADREKGIHYLEQAAHANMPKAQYEIAQYYIEGIYMPQNRELGMTYLFKATDNGFQKAYETLKEELFKMESFYAFSLCRNLEIESPYKYYTLGYYYCEGIENSLTIDYQAAAEAYERAIQLNKSVNTIPVEHIKHIGNYFFEVKNNYKKGVYWYNLAVDLGDAISCYVLGKVYFEGLGVNQNFLEAFTHFNKALQRGITKSKVYLGRCYMQGLGTERNKEIALQLLNEGATESPEVYNDIGRYYIEKQDYESAATYYKMADVAGVLGELGENLYELVPYFETKKDYASAWYWLMQPCVKNTPKGGNTLANYYFHGYYVEQDEQKAIEIWEAIASQGYKNAVYKLYKIYSQGEQSIGPNSEKANRLLDYLVEIRDPLGLRTKGRLYMQTNPKQYLEAAKWYDQLYECKVDYLRPTAIDLEEIATYFLTNQNIHQANKWFVRAVEKGSKNAYVELGKIAMQSSGSEREKAFNYFSQGLRAGILIAKPYLAHCYYKGIGTSIDYAKAYQYFADSAKDDEPLGLYGYAFCLINGIGVKKSKENEKTIFEALSKAVQKNHRMAHVLLGDCYELGIGVQASLDKALYHYLKPYTDDENLMKMIEDEDYVSAYEYIKGSKYYTYHKMLFLYLGKGTKQDKIAACEIYANYFKSESISDICSNYVVRPVLKYRIANDVIEAGIEYEKAGDKIKAIAYYKAALINHPKAGILLSRILFEQCEKDALALLHIMSTWQAEDKIYRKCRSIAHSMLGLYYEYYYLKVVKNQTSYTREATCPFTSNQSKELMREHYMNSEEEEAYKRVCSIM